MTTSHRIAKWVMELQEFEYTFKIEDSNRDTLAYILTYKVHEKQIKFKEHP